MRILHVIPSVSKKRGGPSTAIINMVRALRIEGVDASILTTNDNSKYRIEDWPLASWFWMDHVPIIMFPTLSTRLRLFDEYQISPDLSLWLIKNIKNYDALHVHSIFSYASTTSMLIARAKKVPYIVRTIGQLNSWSLSQSRLKKVFMLRSIERANLIGSFGIHVTSHSEREDLKLICDHKNILCLELGVDIPLRNSPEPQSISHETRFVFLSRIHPKKRLDVLLSVFGDLYNRLNHKSWKLFIAGEGESEYLEFLKQLVNKYGISDRIEWMGHLSGDRKTKLLATSDWFLLPSHSENFGLSVIEALAQGVPVIISKEVGISDVVKRHNAGIVCENTADLEKSLILALQGVPMHMRHAAVELVQEKFSWTKIAKKLKLFYTSLPYMQARQ